MKSWQEYAAEVKALEATLSKMRTTLSQHQALADAHRNEIARTRQKLERMVDENIRRRRLMLEAIDALKEHDPRHPIIRAVKDEIAYSVQIERGRKDAA